MKVILVGEPEMADNYVLNSEMKDCVHIQCQLHRIRSSNRPRKSWKNK